MALRLRASSVALASVSWCVQVFVEPGDQLLSVPWLNLTQPSRFFSQSLKSIVMFRNLYCSYVCMYVAMVTATVMSTWWWTSCWTEENTPLPCEAVNLTWTHLRSYLAGIIKDVCMYVCIYVFTYPSMILIRY